MACWLPKQDLLQGATQDSAYLTLEHQKLWGRLYRGEEGPSTVGKKRKVELGKRGQERKEGAGRTGGRKGQEKQGKRCSPDCACTSHLFSYPRIKPCNCSHW